MHRGAQHVIAHREREASEHPIPRRCVEQVDHARREHPTEPVMDECFATCKSSDSIERDKQRQASAWVHGRVVLWDVMRGSRPSSNSRSPGLPVVHTDGQHGNGERRTGRPSRPRALAGGAARMATPTIAHPSGERMPDRINRHIIGFSECLESKNRMVLECQLPFLCHWERGRLARSGSCQGWHVCRALRSRRCGFLTQHTRCKSRMIWTSDSVD